MNDDLKKAVAKSQATVHEPHTQARAGFRVLLVTNPNYFGNLVESAFKPVLPICCNTHYEELGCVGYQPQQQRLEGVVYVYQPSGYGTDVCGPGTPEYVRFYLSYDHGATWQDQGLTSFQAFNIPSGTEGSKRLEYAVSLGIDPHRRFCQADPLVRVRAILSWNDTPPAAQPNWQPVWGNVREVAVQIEPRRFVFPPELFEVVKAKLPPLLKEIVEPHTPIPTATKSLSVGELALAYKDKGVPVHRFAFKELTAFAAGKTSLGAGGFLKQFPDLVLPPDLGGLLFPTTDGDTSYEELRCIGLDPNAPDTLVGVIHVKRPSGFSGGPCTSGSLEYVTFWADLDGSGNFSTCFGTASVRVYDLAGIGPEGVYYAVRLPVDLSPYRQACAQGPKVVRVRAILSWNSAPSCSNPKLVPVWGNREETLIHIYPSVGAPAGKIAILGGIPVSLIDSVSGLTTPSAVFATNNLPPDATGRPCPFAARVTVQGAPVLGYSYMVEVTPAGGGVPAAVVTRLWLTRSDGTIYPYDPNPVTKRFNYVPFSDNINGVMAQWDSSGNDKWEVKLTVFDGAGTPQGTDTHLIQLDNTGPEASIDITSGTGDCGKFPIGTLLSGVFIARDDYLGSYSLGIEPAVNPAGIGVPSPSSGSSDTAPAPGDPWSLDTAGMRSCGYVIRVVVIDRAIVNSQAVGHYNSDSAGFCLESGA